MNSYRLIEREKLPGGTEIKEYSNGHRRIVLYPGHEITAAVRRQDTVCVLVGKDAGSEEAALAWAAALQPKDFKKLRDWRA